MLICWYVDVLCVDVFFWCFFWCFFCSFFFVFFCWCFFCVDAFFGHRPPQERNDITEPLSNYLVWYQISWSHPRTSARCGCVNVLVRWCPHINTSTHQHVNTSTHQHINTSTHQHINTSTHQLNTSTHQHISLGSSVHRTWRQYEPGKSPHSHQHINTWMNEIIHVI